MHMVPSLLLAAMLSAQDSTPGGEAAPRDPLRPDAVKLHAKLDRDGDGRLTPAEVPAGRRPFVERLLKLADKDRDGALSAAEFQAGVEKSGPRKSGRPEKRRAGRPGQGSDAFRPRQLLKLDRDGDGRITLEEVPKPRRPFFKRMLARLDKDGDGAVSKDELAAFRGGPQPARPGTPGDERPEKARGALFALVDGNGDGKLERSELRQALRLFGRLDVDGDGALSQMELVRAARERPAAGDGRRPRKAERKQKKQPAPRAF